MAKRSSITRNQHHGDDASSRKRMTTCVSGDAAPWSDLNNDLLFLVMMQLGVVDFLAFSGVCKRWRSFAVSNKKVFMASRPPMFMWISDRPYKKECCLQDFEGRKYKTLLPYSGGRTCFSVTCGYLILFGRKTRDFWLVNLVTRHKLHFPALPYYVSIDLEKLRAILVFSPSMSRWVFVMLHRFTFQVWFSIEGTRAWNHVSSTFQFLDLHTFKGKIYTLNFGCRLCEVILNPEPKLKLVEIKNILRLDFFYQKLVSWGENLYVMDFFQDRYMVLELDFVEMKWVLPKIRTGEYALFHSDLKYVAVIKKELWAKYFSQYEKYAYIVYTNKSEKCRLFTAKMWYFPHDCMNVNRIAE